MLKGYKGIGRESGKYIKVYSADDYAAEQCGIVLTSKTTDEFRNMFVEWFYSGNWMEDNDDTL
jgi:hypothetical protein